MKVNINKFTKYPSKVSKESVSINIYDDNNIEDLIEEVMTFNENLHIDEL